MNLSKAERFEILKQFNIDCGCPYTSFQILIFLGKKIIGGPILGVIS